MKYLSHATFIRQVVLPFRAEFDTFSQRTGGDGLFHFGNDLLGPVDAEVLYSVIRYKKPDLVIEIGAGWSTLLIREALRENGSGLVESYDPAAPDFLPDAHRADASEAPFYMLKEGNILFVDGSHIRSPGSDVDLMFSTVLPSLPDGVWVHFHDIFLPDAYPASWSSRNYDEQDHLSKFVEANPEWSVLFSAHHAQATIPESLEKAFRSYDETRWPGSFWMRRKS